MRRRYAYDLMRLVESGSSASVATLVASRPRRSTVEPRFVQGACSRFQARCPM